MGKYKYVDVPLTNEIKRELDIMIDYGVYGGDVNRIVSAAIGYLIKQREKALSIRKKAFSKKIY